MARFVSVGDTVTESVTQTSRKPKWLKWTNASTLTGKVMTPTGSFQDQGRGVYDWTGREFIIIDDILLPATDAAWRATIFAPNGSYITSTGKGDVPTIGTPVVRIAINAPSKAVIKFPIMKGNAKDVLASTFAEWSDGHAEAISRGMQIRVEFRNTKTNGMESVFDGMIFQIESSETITVTAYDSMMMLAQYSDQFQSHGGYTQDDTSRARSTSGSNFVYTFNNAIGTLTSATSENLLQIDAISAMGHGSMTNSKPRFFIHPLPSISSYTPGVNCPITRVKTKIYVGVSGIRKSGTPQMSTAITCTVRARVVLYQKISGAMSQVNATGYQTITCSASAISATASNTVEQELTWTVNWPITGSGYYIGVEVINDGVIADAPVWWQFIMSGAYAEYNSNKLTFTGNYYTSGDGTAWTEVASGDHPEVAIQFKYTGSGTTTSLFTISGSQLTIAQSNVPAGPPSDGYLSTVDKGISYTISYFVSGGMGLREIVELLIMWAGLYPNVVRDNLGSTDYYTSSTYDYLTCILELIKASGVGIKSDVYGNTILVYPRHWAGETPALTFTTNPGSAGEQEIISHDLTAHWASEKATQAYIAENVTSSGLPVALETDDANMPDSLVNALQTPLRSIIADTSLGTHDLLANAAGGKMVDLHTNIIEGKMVLAGYRTDIWDFSYDYVGGRCIKINVPEYGVNGNAVPTEIILGDGVTQVSLDNIRTADRNEISNSMGKADDAISNGASSLPDTVYIFSRIDTYDTTEGNGITRGTVTSVSLYGSNLVTPIATQSNTSYIKMVTDSAGYAHVLAIFPSSAVPTGYATTEPIREVRFVMGGTTYYGYFPNAKYAYAGQNIHVDIRFKSTGIYIPNLM